MNEYTAIVSRSAPGWSIYVPQVDRHTYAAHLREIEEMAHDLVQVMTDQPDDDIHVTVQLPPELANPIAAMHAARDTATAAETAARDAQWAAATALRNSGAPLRDIAAALNISHQRVHQILEAADAARAQLLDRFRHDIDVSLAYGSLADFNLPVVADTGGAPVVVALSDELLDALISRLDAEGGYANVFVRHPDGRTSFVAVVNETCALGEPDDDMTEPDEQPGEGATVGAFLDWVGLNEGGVTIRGGARRPVCVRDAQTVELTSA